MKSSERMMEIEVEGDLEIRGNECCSLKRVSARE